MNFPILHAGLLPEETPVTLTEEALVLDRLPRHDIAIAPWRAFPGRPRVQFAIAHYNGGIVLKYFVEEGEIRAVNTVANDPVWQDSCVEFFLSFDGGASYYNLEFNCIGTGLIGWGASRRARVLLPPETVSRVQVLSGIRRQETGLVAWQLTLLIPLQVFAHTGSFTLSGHPCTANFYKCGDALATPHYLSWSPIDTPDPDFHRPEFFGTVLFD